MGMRAYPVTISAAIMCALAFGRVVAVANFPAIGATAALMGPWAAVLLAVGIVSEDLLVLMAVLAVLDAASRACNGRRCALGLIASWVLGAFFVVVASDVLALHTTGQRVSVDRVRVFVANGPAGTLAMGLRVVGGWFGLPCLSSIAAVCSLGWYSFRSAELHRVPPATVLPSRRARVTRRRQGGEARATAVPVKRASR